MASCTQTLHKLCSLNLFYYIKCRRGLWMRILSVCQTGALWQNGERSVQIFIPYQRSFSLVFWEAWLVGGDHFYLLFWVNWPSLERNRQFRTDIRSSASAVTPSVKLSINTNRKSTTRFPVSLRWSSYVAQKRWTAVLRLKSHFA